MRETLLALLCLADTAGVPAHLTC
ncbi:protein of unknown function [Thauera humireducens]|nr:protein of unknown function [Thauera humireducens]